MRLIFKLVCANFRQHWVRMMLTLLAMMASATIVVWGVSGYDAMAGQFRQSVVKLFGKYSLIVAPTSSKMNEVDPDLIPKLEKDPRIASLNPIMQTRLQVMRGDATLDEMKKMRGVGGRRGGPGEKRTENTKTDPNNAEKGRGRPMMFGFPSVVGTDASESPTPMIAGEWITPKQYKKFEGVLTSKSAEGLGVSVGDNVKIYVHDKEYEIKVIGIVEQLSLNVELGGSGRGGRPKSVATSVLYLPIPLVELITEEDRQYTFINVQLKKESDSATFVKEWAPQLAQFGTELVSIKDTLQGMEDGQMARSAKMQAYSATGISLMAALFIIFTTLNMGVNERVRQFAILRAVAFNKKQIVITIMIESLFLALLGWLGGLLAGWGMLEVFADKFVNQRTGTGVELGAWCIALAGISAFGGSLLAAILPAWKATRISPLDALSPQKPVKQAKLSVMTMGIGIVFILANPLVAFFIPIPESIRLWVLGGLGFVVMGIGFLMFTPSLILLVEKFLAPIVARIIGIEPRLLANQFSGNIWSIIGTTVSMSVGLGLYISMLVWGYSMLPAFVPGDWVPDLLATIQSGGLLEKDINQIKELQEIDSSACLPLLVEQPKLADDLTGCEVRNSVARQDNVIIVGMNAESALLGDNPVLKIPFVEGDVKTAVQAINSGRGCLVPDHFAKETNLKIGDSFKVIPPENPTQIVEYKIAGIVRLEGWHWMTKFNGFRRRSGRSAALIFANYETVKKDFQLKRINFIWMNLKKGISVEQVGKLLEPFTENCRGIRQPVNAQGTWAGSAQQFGSNLRITTREGSREQIFNRSSNMIWAMCQLPLITLLVSILALINTVMASVRARRWEFGIMRSIGVTRGEIVKLIIAESLLIGLVACLLSLGFGVLAGWCGTAVTQMSGFFGGLGTHYVIPWGQVSFGLGLTMILSILAALWPAITTGRTEILKLLKDGRSSM